MQCEILKFNKVEMKRFQRELITNRFKILRDFRKLYPMKLNCMNQGVHNPA